MRLPSVLNWILLCVNALLFGFLLLIGMVSRGWLGPNPAARRLQGDAETLGKEVYWARGPFALFVAKDFPRDESFLLLYQGQHGQPLDLSAQDLTEQDGGTTKQVVVGLGETFGVTVEYSDSPADGCQVQMLLLTRTLNERWAEGFFDYKADGSFDTRHVWDLERHTSRLYVFYENDWREAKKHISQYDQVLADGQEVIFDMQTGKWRPVEAKPSAGDGSGSPRSSDLLKSVESKLR